MESPRPACMAALAAWDSRSARSLSPAEASHRCRDLRPRPRRGAVHQRGLRLTRPAARHPLDTAPSTAPRPGAGFGAGSGATELGRGGGVWPPGVRRRSRCGQPPAPYSLAHQQPGARHIELASGSASCPGAFVAHTFSADVQDKPLGGPETRQILAASRQIVRSCAQGAVPLLVEHGKDACPISELVLAQALSVGTHIPGRTVPDVLKREVVRPVQQKRLGNLMRILEASFLIGL